MLISNKYSANLAKCSVFAKPPAPYRRSGSGQMFGNLTGRRSGSGRRAKFNLRFNTDMGTLAGTRLNMCMKPQQTAEMNTPHQQIFSPFAARREAFFNGRDNLQLRSDLLELDRVDPIGGDLVIYEESIHMFVTL